MKPTDEEFEIVEEIVDDLDYFYEEDEEISGTIKVRRKLLIRNILLGILAFLIITTVLGYVQISIYCDGRETTVVTPDYKDKVIYLDTTEKIYEELIAFYSTNSSGTNSGALFDNVRIVDGEKAVNNVNSAKSASYVNATIEKINSYLEKEQDFYELLPGNKKNDEFYSLHAALFSCLESCYNILYIASENYEFDKSELSNQQELKNYISERANLMSCWQNAKSKL